MKKRSKRIALIISAIIVAIVLIGAGYYIYTRFVPQNIKIDEIQKTAVIDKPYRAISLLVTGVQTNVIITKDTRVASATLAGVRNDLILCYGIHNVTVQNVGINCVIKYIAC